MVNGKARRLAWLFTIYHLPLSISLACSSTPSPSITVDRSVTPPVIEVRGLPSRDITAISRASPGVEDWQQILRVSVEGAALPIAGRYSAGDGVIRFRPMYALDSPQNYTVRFDPAKIPGADASDAWRAEPLTELVTFARRARAPSTVVKAVYPSGAELPENMLRFYIEFSAPMGRAAALEHVRLIDADGNHVVDPFLPVEAEFWTPDRTRFTLFFDPGRVKRGIKPNRDLGRALVPGKRYALVIGERWTDGRGQPLKSEYRHEFLVSRAIERPLDQAAWRIDPPKHGTREALVVTFPWALDHGLLRRALGVRRGGTDVPGDVAVDAGETRWTFTPRDPWATDNYGLVALTLLEDPAGNRLGRAFEVMQPMRDERDSIEVPFTVQ